MAIAKITGAQRDFSAGELDTSVKRADDNPIMKAGARQLSNWRILNSKSLTNRPGRTAVFLSERIRVDEVTMTPGNTFFIAFGDTSIAVLNSAGAIVFASGAIPWNNTTVQQIVWDVYELSIYIASPSGPTQVLTWDGVATWSLQEYAEGFVGGQKRTLFYRLSPKGVTIQPTAYSGSVSVLASDPIFQPGQVGTRIRYAGRQILLTQYNGPLRMDGTVQEPLYNSSRVRFTSDPTAAFNVNDIVLSQISSVRGIVSGFAGGSFTMDIVRLNGNNPFINSEAVVGPNGSAVIAAPGGEGVLPTPSSTIYWDDEVINPFRGYPSSVFVDQGRVGFCNIPAVPGGVAWSAFGVPDDLYVGALPTDAIFELAPGKSRVLFVVPGPESSEFVFCDNGVYYIPISVTNPLKPGSVAFNLISKDGCAQIQPRNVQEIILWINAGLTSVLAIVAPGAYNRPYEMRNLSELHGHLFNSPVAIAVPSTTSQFEERYAYVLNGDGTVVVGKYNTESGQIKGTVGWLPWNGVGAVKWMSANNSDVLFATNYAPNGIAPISVIERLDANQYLDAAMSVNSAPVALAAPPGKGPLWWLAGGTVTLMDNATRMMGTYTIDANGVIVPQNNGGENLASATLVAGQPWTAVLEPFVPDAQPGQSVHQRMFKRRVSRFAAYVINSSGFMMARLFSGPITPTSPALGTVMNIRRIATWNQGDDPTQSPPLREEVQRWRPLGRSYDPRVAIIKDTPGPLEIPELGIEATI